LQRLSPVSCSSKFPYLPLGALSEKLLMRVVSFPLHVPVHKATDRFDNIMQPCPISQIVQPQMPLWPRPTHWHSLPCSCYDSAARSLPHLSLRTSCNGPFACTSLHGTMHTAAAAEEEEGRERIIMNSFSETTMFAFGHCLGTLTGLWFW
jgi:hypothetical protein